MLKVLSLALRARYIVPATAVGGYYSAKRKYEDFKESLPEMPDFVKNLLDGGRQTIDSIDLDSWSASLGESARVFNSWIEEASEELKQRAEASKSGPAPVEMPRDYDLSKKNPNRVKANDEHEPANNAPSPGTSFISTLQAVGVFNEDKRDNFGKREAEEHSNTRKELLNSRKEIDKLRKEIRELQSALRATADSQTNRRFKKSLIELYSEILDELSAYDSSYKVQDNLPKVVVVGDQSSGKTSVLEMIAGARIFPRGAGEMMTRAPIQVTLGEGTHHIAKFNDSLDEYDLTKESQLAKLREEIEIRMRKSVEDGKTVSNQVISLTIQGPGIQRMVLVDLPGLINVKLNDLAPGTKESIENMVKEYIKNPNAIILCILDAAVDADRSLFSGFVHEADQDGKRTIFVLTKVDIAEKTCKKPLRIKKILDGEIFPNKALGYYAIVAGNERNDEDIQKIKDYEEKFFSTSSLCQDGILNPSQCTTRKLSEKVSDCFWTMVRESIEQQVDTYKVTLWNLEAEWNRLFPSTRQLTRDELFYNARDEILNGVAKLSRLSPKSWDQYLSTELWQRVRSHIVESIYFKAAQDPHQFNAKVDIELQRWIESLELPKLAIGVAQDSVKHQFDNMLHSKEPFGRVRRKDSSEAEDDAPVDQDLKKAVIDDALRRHRWRSQAVDVLRVIQLEALSKQILLTRENWEKAMEFLRDSLKEQVKIAGQELTSLTGSTGFIDNWLRWKSTTPEQRRNRLIQEEFDRLLTINNSQDNSASLIRGKLSEAEIATIKKNLEAQGVDLDSESILRVWQPYQRYMFSTYAIHNSLGCKLFHLCENELDGGADCSHVMFFLRIKRMLESTANSLRTQISDECRRIEHEIMEVLEEYNLDESKKVELLSGKRVELAEEVRRVKQVRAKLDEFITELNQESNT